MSNPSVDVLLHGLAFDFLGLAIALLTIIQIVWGMFALE